MKTIRGENVMDQLGFTYCPHCGKQTLQLKDVEIGQPLPDRITYIWACFMCHTEFKQLMPAPVGIAS